MPTTVLEGARPKLGYFTNLYPSPSHTFIRREIEGLQAMGYEVERFAVKCGDNLVTPADLVELELTTCLFSGPMALLLLTALPFLLLFAPGLPQALRAMFQMNRASPRGLFAHFAYLLEAAKLAGLSRKRSVRHMHVHFGTNAAAVARLSYLMGGPTYSMTIHGPDEFDGPVALSLREKVRDAKFVVAITDFCASQLMRWSDLESWKKIIRVHCTVPDQWFDEAAPIPADSKQLVCVGRLSAQKGQLLLLQAMRKVVDSGVDGRLVLVGDGEMREEIERQVDALRLREHVTITGWQSEAEVRKHLLASRALVMASFAEGLPMVIMEALALHRPVVVTRISGVPELVQPGRHGWLVTPGNVDELAQAMRAALTTPVAELDAMGGDGAERVRERHSVGTEVRKIERYLGECLSLPCAREALAPAWTGPGK